MLITRKLYEFKEEKMGVASLVLGILSTLMGLFSAGALGWLGIILGIIGIVLGALGRKNPDSKGIATAGLVLSIVGLILSAVLYIACAACIAGLSSTGS
jgi:uncharacterized membrane protein HdeD (DUF308 family)